MRRLLLLVLPALMLTACVSQKDMVVTNPAAVRPAKPKTAPVSVYMGDDKPVRPYTQVGVASATNEDLSDNVKDLQDQARKVGADAVLVHSGNRAGEDITNEGVVIVWTGASAPQPAATPASHTHHSKSHQR